MIDLKPCPFCGGVATWCGDDEKEPHDCDQIYCDKCGINFDSYHKTVKYAGSLKKAKKAMAKLWNKRVQS